MTARKTRIDFSAITDENSNAFNDVVQTLNNPTEDQSNSTIIKDLVTALQESAEVAFQIRRSLVKNPGKIFEDIFEDLHRSWHEL